MPQKDRNATIVCDPKDVFRNPALIFQHFRYRGDDEDEEEVIDPKALDAMRALNKRVYARYQAIEKERKREQARVNRHKPPVKYRAYRRSAAKRGHVFQLSERECFHMFQSPCHYCHRPPELPLTNGIDRVDNDGGYTSDNTVPCCAPCNFMKHSCDYDEFIKQCNAIATAQANNAENEK